MRSIPREGEREGYARGRQLQALSPPSPCGESTHLPLPPPPHSPSPPLPPHRGEPACLGSNRVHEVQLSVQVRHAIPLGVPVVQQCCNYACTHRGGGRGWGGEGGCEGVPESNSAVTNTAPILGGGGKA